MGNTRQKGSDPSRHLTGADSEVRVHLTSQILFQLMGQEKEEERVREPID